MPSKRQRWYQKLRISNAYGQLIALIFLPIMVLSCVGAALVLVETARSSRAEQRNAAFASLARYQPTAQKLNVLIDQPNNHEKIRSIMQNMLNEAHVMRVAMIDFEGRPRVSFGYGNSLAWPEFPITSESFGPLESEIGTTYGLRAGYTSDGPIWLVVDMDNQPMQLARYRVWLVLSVTGLITLLLLLLCLNFYSRRWIAPMYEIRLQLQRLTADTLGNRLVINGSGELALLQQDIIALLDRLHISFEELSRHTEQTEEDLRRTLDALEIQNITYRKARDLAVSANQSKSVFLANISHELRTPLNSIDGFINLLARKGTLSDEQNLYVQTIRKSSAHLLALVNDVLDFSKIDAGKLVLEQAPFDLEEAVFDVMDMLSPLASDKQLDMAVYYYDDMPKQVIGDALRFKQILTNLVSNAIKFTPDGDIIVRVRLEDTLNGQHTFHISVQDSGIGLSGTDRKQLFESFSQGDPSVTRQYGGTGLGLAISRQLVQLMSGKIGFEDNQERHPTDKGSTFWFTVCLNEVAQNQQELWPNLSGWRVLSYIHHPANANVLRGYLSHLFVEQQEAQSLPDLFGRITPFNEQNNPHSWMIVDAGADIQGLLKEIRTRYHGALAVYGYQMALDPALLKRYNAVPLYQPMSRSALIALLQHQQADHKTDAYPEFLDHNIHVLAVDDHLPNLMVLDALLTDLGVQVSTVTSGGEALEQIGSRHEIGYKSFDLIFMDIQMPRMSGLETAHAIRQLEQEWNSTPVPIIALTAHALSDEKENLLAAGMNDYVGKPIQIEQLIHILLTWTAAGHAQSNSNTTGNFHLEHGSNNANGSTFYPDDFSADSFYLQSAAEPRSFDTDPDILDWQESLRLSAGKKDLALELLQMLVSSFSHETILLQQLISDGDYYELEQRIHRMYGATRYIGLPQLQTTAHAFEQLLSMQRQQRKLTEESLNQQISEHFERLTAAMAAVEQTAMPLLQG